MTSAPPLFFCAAARVWGKKRVQKKGRGGKEKKKEKTASPGCPFLPRPGGNREKKKERGGG